MRRSKVIKVPLSPDRPPTSELVFDNSSKIGQSHGTDTAPAGLKISYEKIKSNKSAAVR